MSTVSYVGLGPEWGRRIEEEDAFEYAMLRIQQSKEEQKEFVEWYYSGNWIREKEE